MPWLYLICTETQGAQYNNSHSDHMIYPSSSQPCKSCAESCTRSTTQDKGAGPCYTTSHSVAQCLCEQYMKVATMWPHLLHPARHCIASCVHVSIPAALPCSSSAVSSSSELGRAASKAAAAVCSHCRTCASPAAEMRWPAGSSAAILARSCGVAAVCLQRTERHTEPTHLMQTVAKLGHKE